MGLPNKHAAPIFFYVEMMDLLNKIRTPEEAFPKETRSQSDGLEIWPLNKNFLDMILRDLAKRFEINKFPYKIQAKAVIVNDRASIEIIPTEASQIWIIGSSCKFFNDPKNSYALEGELLQKPQWTQTVSGKTFILKKPQHFSVDLNGYLAFLEIDVLGKQQYDYVLRSRQHE